MDKQPILILLSLRVNKDQKTVVIQLFILSLQNLLCMLSVCPFFTFPVKNLILNTGSLISVLPYLVMLITEKHRGVAVADSLILGVSK